jgi:undecaprenyl-diphosphatase
MGAVAALDLAIVRALAGWRTGALDSVAIALTVAGVYGIVWLGLALVRASLVRTPSVRMALLRVVCAVLIADVVSGVLMKPLFARERPFVAHAEVTTVGHRSTSPSFPSGHATIAAAGAVALSLMWPELAVAWWVLALATMAARVYMGMHYPTDVIGGALVGLACGWLATGGARCYTARPVTLGVPR